jgi:hypothetical protein
MRSRAALLFLDDLPVSVLVADLLGTELNASLSGAVTCTDGTAGDLSVIDLRDGTGSSAVESAAEVGSMLDDRERRHAEMLTLNEETLAPRWVGFADETSDGTVRLQLRTSRYSRFLAAAEILSGVPLAARVEAMLRRRLGTPPELSHTLGVNCTLETSDGALVWTRRTERTAIDGGCLAPAMNEGASAGDLVDGRWSPMTTALRGFHEELGLDACDFLSSGIRFHSLISQVANGGIAVLGHAVTSLTADQVLRRHSTAVDQEEAEGGIVLTDASHAGVELLLTTHPTADWVGWAPACIEGLSRLSFDGRPLARIGSDSRRAVGVA